jgi:hypothetical protein
MQLFGGSALPQSSPHATHRRYNRLVHHQLIVSQVGDQHAALCARVLRIIDSSVIPLAVGNESAQVRGKQLRFGVYEREAAR